MRLVRSGSISCRSQSDRWLSRRCVALDCSPFPCRFRLVAAEIEFLHQLTYSKRRELRIPDRGDELVDFLLRQRLRLLGEIIGAVAVGSLHLHVCAAYAAVHRYVPFLGRTFDDADLAAALRTFPVPVVWSFHFCSFGSSATIGASSLAIFVAFGAFAWMAR